jgi:hypothetical protein
MYHRSINFNLFVYNIHFVFELRQDKVIDQYVHGSIYGSKKYSSAIKIFCIIFIGTVHVINIPNTTVLKEIRNLVAHHHHHCFCHFLILPFQS